MKTRIPKCFTSLLLIVVGMALPACHPETAIESEKASILPVADVRVQAVEMKPGTMTLEVAGTVQAKLHAILEAKVSGRISTLPVVPGQLVMAGELVARLDAAEINARLDQAEASRDQAELDWNRATSLFENEALTRVELDAAGSRRRIATAAAAEAQAMISYLEITAPFQGVVTKKWAEVGDFAAPGKPLIALEDPAMLQMEADIPQSIAPRIQQGAQLAVQVDGIPDVLTGSVREIAPTADPTTHTFRVTLDLPGHADVRTGQFARLLVPIGEKAHVRVPQSALVVRGQMEIVFVVADQTAHLRLVKSGKPVGEEVEILSGLHAGDRVVIEGGMDLHDGQKVEIK